MSGSLSDYQPEILLNLIKKGKYGVDWQTLAAELASGLEHILAFAEEYAGTNTFSAEYEALSRYKAARENNE